MIQPDDVLMGIIVEKGKAKGYNKTRVAAIAELTSSDVSKILAGNRAIKANELLMWMWELVIHVRDLVETEDVKDEDSSDAERRFKNECSIYLNSIGIRYSKEKKVINEIMSLIEFCEELLK